MSETGEAAPEITKLPLLARTFGVTADWLLDDEAEFEEDTPEEEAGPDEPAGAADNRPVEQTYPEWIDRLPGFLGRMVKKYGWLYGVRMAISGALFLMIGLVANAMFTSMASGFSAELPGFSGGVTFYDEAGNIVDPSHLGLTASDLGAMGLGSSSGYSTFSVTTMTKPIDIFCGFVIFLGLIMLIGGLLLALYLKRKGQESL